MHSSPHKLLLDELMANFEKKSQVNLVINKKAAETLWQLVDLLLGYDLEERPQCQVTNWYWEDIDNNIFKEIY